MKPTSDAAMPYDRATEHRMRTLYSRLSEMDRRAYAAVEAYKLGRGGVGYITLLFGMSPETIKSGQRDLDAPGEVPQGGRQRRPGAGRKGVLAEQPGLEEAFERIVETRIGGDPMNPDVRWTDLQPGEISERLADEGFSASENTVRSLLKKKDLRKRKPVKMVSVGTCDPDIRNEQFEIIGRLREDYEGSGYPALSVDTKKKEFLGGLFRDGSLYSRGGEPLKRFDHDYPYLAEGKVIPHGIYDLRNNTGFITLGTSRETPAFIADSLRRWLRYRGRYDYPGSGRMLLLLDAGGANSYRSTEFKCQMLRFAADTGMTVRVAHYPPYCSKWNPVEHRLFPHVTRSMQGVYLDSPETVTSCIEARAATSTGLTTRAHILDKTYTKKKSCADLPDRFPLVPSSRIPHLNYTCYPSDEWVGGLN